MPRAATPLAAVAELALADGRLRPIALADAALLTDWRNRHGHAFFSQFRATVPRTRGWLRGQVIDNPERILFMVEDDAGRPYGHIGLTRPPEAVTGGPEVDNMLRGVDGVCPGGMDRAARRLFAWAFDDLGCPSIDGRLFADNDRSLRHHLRIGFRVVARVGLRSVDGPSERRWVEDPDVQPSSAERTMLRIRLDPSDFTGTFSLTTSASGRKPTA